MKKTIDFILNHPIISFIALMIVTVFFGRGIALLEMQNTQDSELPEDNEMVKTKKNIEGFFGKKEIVLVGIESDNVFTVETLEKIRHIEDEIKDIPGIITDEVVSIVSVNNIDGSSGNLEVGEYIKNVPYDSQKLNELRENALKNELIVNRIISKNGRFSAIIANIESGYSEEVVYSKVDDIAKKYSNPEHIFISGDPIQQKEIDMGIQNDMRKLLPIAILLLVIAYFYSFRTVFGVLLPLGIVLLSIVWTMGTIN